MTLVRRLPPGWSLWPESTIVLDPTNAPLPDFAVIRGANPLDFATADRYPGPGDVGLLIEVAVTSLRDDLTTALEQYARALIPVYWVVDVPGRRILVHSEPRVVDGRGEYARVRPTAPVSPCRWYSMARRSRAFPSMSCCAESRRFRMAHDLLPVTHSIAMPRPLRLVDERLVCHVINRGNNRAPVFFDDGASKGGPAKVSLLILDVGWAR